MAKGYSKDLRARAVALVEDGESRREAARVLGLGASTAIRWIERWATTGSVAALPGTGHCRSPLEAHRQWLLDLVAAEPDLTLEEIRTRLKSEKRLKTGTTSVWRFYERHDITFKKNSARRRTGSSRCRCSACRAEGRAIQAERAAPCLHRRDGGYDQDGPASRPLTTWRASRCERAARPLEDADARCRATHQWPDGALCH